MTSFDLSSVSSLHYRNMNRPARWAGVGFFLFFTALIAWQLAVHGFEPILLALVAGDAFLVWFVVYYTAPGPVELRQAESGFDFVYAGGRKRRVALDGAKLRLKLAERVLIPNPRQFERAIDDARYFAMLGVDRMAITPEAFEYLAGLIRNSGYATRTRTKPNPPVGSWHIQEFNRAKSN